MQPKRILLALLLSLAAVSSAAAQDYPTRAITLVVPSAAGGANDLAARVVGEQMARTLGQSIVIENRAGAGGSIATRQVARAEPDGYTLVIGGTGTLSVNPTLHSNVGYETAKDFTPVGMIALSPLVLVAHPGVPAKTVPELIALAKADPEKITFASSGVGSGIHLSGELFAAMAGIKMTHVPYKGSNPALKDLVGGHVALYFSSMPPAVSLVKDGQVRALAVTSLTRSPVFPDVPTVSENGIPGYEAGLHFGIVAPAGTPRPIVDKLNAAMREALAMKEVQEKLAKAGMDSSPGTPEEYGAYLEREGKKWAGVIKTAGIKTD